MKDAVDVYAKLLVAVLGFVAPTITLLLPLLGDRLKSLQHKLETEKSNLNKQKDSNTQIIEEAISKFPEATRETYRAALSKAETVSETDLKKSIASVEIQISELKLKKQVKKVFLLLFASLGLVMLYHIKQIEFINFKGCHLLDISPLYLSLSLLMFTFAIDILWRLVCVIIEIKEVPESIPSKIEQKKEDNAKIPTADHANNNDVHN